MIYARVAYPDGRVGVTSAADDKALRAHCAKLGEVTVSLITQEQAATLRAEMRRNSPPSDADKVRLLEERLEAIERAYRALATGQP